MNWLIVFLAILVVVGILSFLMILYLDRQEPPLPPPESGGHFDTAYLDDVYADDPGPSPDGRNAT